MSRLNGKTALVTGGARGIGAAIAQAMVDEGAHVVIADVLDAEGALLAAKLGPVAAYVRLDVTRPPEWEIAVAAALARFGRLDVLVNNAGISTYGLIESYSHADWDKTLAVNLTGVFNGIKAAIPALRQAGGGAIVNIPSAAGMAGYTGIPGYVASTSLVPLDRTGQPAEVGELVVYLASDASSFATGAEFVLDGGQSAGRIVWGVDDDTR